MTLLKNYIIIFFGWQIKSGVRMSSGLEIRTNFSKKTINKYTFDFIESDNFDDKVVLTTNDSMLIPEYNSNAGIASFNQFTFDEAENEAWHKEKVHDKHKTRRFELDPSPTTLIMLSKGNDFSEKIIFDGNNCNTLDEKLSETEKESKQYKQQQIENSKQAAEDMEIKLMEVRLMEMFNQFQNIDQSKLRELDMQVGMLAMAETTGDIVKITHDIEQSIKETPELRYSWVHYMQCNGGIEEKINAAGINTPIINKSDEEILMHNMTCSRG